MGLLKGHNAVVTGAAQGIGFEVARLFLAEGAQVVLSDVREQAALNAAQVLRDCGAPAVGTGCDVTVEEEMEALLATCAAEFGPLTIMVNNAGVTRDASMRTMSTEDFRAVIDTHLTGTWLGTKFASLAMRAQGSGSIINVSSIAGKIGNAGQTNYSAAKAGIIGLSKAAAKEVAHANVRINVVQPGLIRTPMTESMPAEVWASKLAEVPMARAGEPAEVAKVALFLASDLSSYLTGAVIEVSGGRAM